MCFCSHFFHFFVAKYFLNSFKPTSCEKKRKFNFIEPLFVQIFKLERLKRGASSWCLRNSNQHEKNRHKRLEVLSYPVCFFAQLSQVCWSRSDTWANKKFNQLYCLMMKFYLRKCKWDVNLFCAVTVSVALWRDEQTFGIDGEQQRRSVASDNRHHQRRQCWVQEHL